VAIAHNGQPDQPDFFAAYDEAVVIVDDARQACWASRNAESVLGVENGTLDKRPWSDLIQSYAAPEASASLYWAVEALFEQYISSDLLPARLYVKPGWVARIVRLDARQVAVRFEKSRAREHEQFLSTYLRPALTSTLGFTDVIMKGIDGPMTDLQVEDLNVIIRDAQFALDLVQDYRAQFVRPPLSSPVPLALDELLALGSDDLPLGKIASRKLSIVIKPAGNVLVYSSQAMRLALIDLVRMLVQVVILQSEIIIGSDSPATEDPFVMVRVSYQPIESSMRAATRIDPLDLFQRRDARNADRLVTIVSSLHAQLSPFGCSAWAAPDVSGEFSVITMTVPRWHGPITISHDQL
jgi:hypothetical protein